MYKSTSKHTYIFLYICRSTERPLPLIDVRIYKHAYTHICLYISACIHRRRLSVVNVYIYVHWSFTCMLYKVVHICIYICSYITDHQKDVSLWSMYMHTWTNICTYINYRFVYTYTHAYISRSTESNLTLDLYRPIQENHAADISRQING